MKKFLKKVLLFVGIPVLGNAWIIALAFHPAITFWGTIALITVAVLAVNLYDAAKSDANSKEPNP